MIGGKNMIMKMRKNEYIKIVSNADTDVLLESIRIMLNEITRRLKHLEIKNENSRKR